MSYRVVRVIVSFITNSWLYSGTRPFIVGEVTQLCPLWGVLSSISSIGDVSSHRGGSYTAMSSISQHGGCQLHRGC